MESLIQIAMRLVGAKEAAVEAEAVSKEVSGLGDSTTVASVKAKKGGSVIGSVFSRLGTVVKAGALAGVAAIGALAWKIKDAVGASEELAKTTAGLHRNLGLTNAAASRWGVIAEARGIDTTSLNMGFTTLSKQVVAAKKGGDAYDATFGKLGITHKQVADGTKNFTGLVMNLADAFGRAKGSAERQAAASTLLGRGYRTLLPLFASGSKSLREQLGWADKYGATMGRGDVKETMELVQAQRELKVASIGLDEQLARVVIPTLVKLLPTVMSVVGGIGHFIAGMDDGEGAGGKFASAVGSVAKYVGVAVGAVKVGVSWVERFVDRLLHGGGDVGKFGQDVKAIGLAIKTVAVTAFPFFLSWAQKLWSGFKDSFGGIANVVQGVVRIVGGILRGDWAEAWKGAKQLFSGVVQSIIGAVKTITAPFRAVFSGIASFISKAFDGIKGPIVDILNFVIDRVNNLIDAHNALPFLPDIPHISNIGESIPMPTVTNAHRASKGAGSNFSDSGNSPGIRGRTVTPRPGPQSVAPSSSSTRPRRGREQPLQLVLPNGRVLAEYTLQIGENEAVLA